MSKRRRFSGELTAKIALEALRGDRTLQEIASKHQVHPNQVSAWNRTLKEQAIYGRVFQRLDDVRAAVADFVERYNQSWRLEKLGYQTPIEAHEAYELRPAA